jgi:hypothetical protein
VYNFATPVLADMTLYAKWIPATLTLSPSPTVPTATVTFNAGVFGIQTTNTSVNVSTDNPTGYQLFLTMDSSAIDTSLHSGTNVLTAGDLSNAGEWAAQGGLVTSWTAVPLLATNPFGFKLADSTVPSASGGDSVSVSFGANIATTTAAGTYSGVVLYTAVAKP